MRGGRDCLREKEMKKERKREDVPVGGGVISAKILSVTMKEEEETEKPDCANTLSVCPNNSLNVANAAID